MNSGWRTLRRHVWLVSIGAFLAVACSSSPTGLDGVTASDERPEFAFVRNNTELLLGGDSGDFDLLLDVVNTPLGADQAIIESIESATAQDVFVGICCEPEAGRQLIVDVRSGSFEIFPLTVRFPSVGEGEGSPIISGGATIAVDNLGAFLAYENGVGVVPRGSLIRDQTGSAIFQPIAVADDRVAFVDGDATSGGGDLVLVDLEGSVLATSTLSGVRLVEYDERNELVVAVAADSQIVWLDPNTLEELARSGWPEPVTSIDVRSGWILLSQTNGEVITAPVDDLSDTELLVEASRGVTAAAWLR